MTQWIEIPEITDPMGKHWEQPNRNKILVDTVDALMDQQTFDALEEYSCSVPSGTYIGKMWKTKWNGIWYLRWYDEIIGNGITIKTKQIHII